MPPALNFRYISAASFFYSPSVGIKKTGFVVGIIAFFLTVGDFLILLHSKKHRPDSQEKGAPDNSGTSLFLIHEGLKVRVVGQLGDWYNIRMADGNEGWVAKGDLEKI